jgi:hypothetical protein
VGPLQQESIAELRPLPLALQEEGSIQGLWGEEGYPQDGNGTPPRCDGGAEHSSTGRSVRDQDSPHPTVERRHHHPRLHEDGRGSGQRLLRIRHRHLDNHLLSPEFGQGARSEQPLPLRIPQSLGVTWVSNNVVLVIACLMIDVVFLCVVGSRGLLWHLVHDLIILR